MTLGCLAVAVLSTSCTTPPDGNPSAIQTTLPQHRGQRDRIMIINSYHAGYNFSDREITAILTELGARFDSFGRVDDRDAAVDIRLHYLDGKHQTDPADLQNTAQRIAAEAQAWKADLVIACDDPAVRYVLAGSMRDLPIPAVYCGVNWSADDYHLPPERITGMVERIFLTELLAAAQPHAAGQRLAFIAADSTTNRKHLQAIAERYGERLVFHASYTNEDELRSCFIAAQDAADIVILGPPAPVIDSPAQLSFARLQSWMLANTTKPTVGFDSWYAGLCLITYGKKPEENGRWSARQALRILGGTAPGAISPTRNQECERFLNLRLAKRLNIRFDPDDIEHAKLIAAQTRHLLYVNSYHPGYAWSDGIEASLIKALNLDQAVGDRRSNSQISMRVMHMDSRRKATPADLEQATNAILAVIDEWRPEVVICSDDNAIKYLAPHLTATNTPLVFCGVNWHADAYDLPPATSTGMIEVDPMDAVVDLLRPHARGDRLGYIGVESFSSRKVLDGYAHHLGLHFADGSLVRTMAELEREYQRLQDSVDMLICITPAGITDWDPARAAAMAQRIARIPSGATLDDAMPLAAIGLTRLPEEQGWWAGQATQRILAGEAAGSIPITRNTGNKVIYHPALASQLGLVIPAELMSKAEIYEAP